MSKVRALVHAWLVVDFFGDARRAGRGHGSSLTTTIFAQSFLALVFATLLYPDVPPVPFAAANLSLSTLLVAIGALGDDARPNRRLADEALVATAPMSRLAVALARCGHAAFHVVLVTIGMALPPAILLAHLTQRPWQVAGYVAMACACSGLATGALGVFARAAARWQGPGKAALLQGTLKAALLGGGLVLFVLGLRRLQGNADGLPIGRFGAELLPTYHAAKWLHEPLSAMWRLLPFVGGALVLLVMAALVGGTANQERMRGSQRSWLQALLQRNAGRGPGRGIAEFVAVSIWRSPGFRARVLPLLGVPVGTVALLVGERQENAFVLLSLLLQLPAIYLPFLIAFLPRADQPGTGWVFAQAPQLSLTTIHDATWRALVTHVLLPVHALALLLLLALTPHRLEALPASLFACSLAVLASRRMVTVLRQVPFTANDEGDTSADLGAAFAAALVLGGLGTVFAMVLPPLGRWGVAGALAFVAVAQLRRLPTAPEPVAANGEPQRNLNGDLRGGLHDGPATDAAPTSRQVATTPMPRRPAPPPLDPATALRRELRAVGVLYAATCLLPWGIGAAFQP